MRQRVCDISTWNESVPEMLNGRPHPEVIRRTQAFLRQIVEAGYSVCSQKTEAVVAQNLRDGSLVLSIYIDIEVPAEQRATAFRKLFQAQKGAAEYCEKFPGLTGPGPVAVSSAHGAPSPRSEH
jgi:hypothetical protein